MSTLSANPTSQLADSFGPSMPSAVWRMLGSDKNLLKLPSGLDALWDLGLGSIKRLRMRRQRFMRRAAEIVALDAQFSVLTDEGLREIVAVVSRQFRLGRSRYVDENRAFALIREAAYRQLGLKPHLVQVAAALAMQAGCVAELATGEGKTLVAVMPAVIAGWRARGCHVITVNDYLAKRDAETMKPIYDFCGLNVSWIDEPMDESARRLAYAADVTYCTNKTVAADFLRDRLTLGQFKDLSSALIHKLSGAGDGADRLLMRGLETALIDEADSVLIDEAATPLIIADEVDDQEITDQYLCAAAVAKQLQANVDFIVDHRYRELTVTSAGRKHIHHLVGHLDGVWRSIRRREELIQQALSAREMFLRDQHYFVEEGKVVIIDESTGRAMPDRSWREGMHQAIEAKEELAVTPDRQTRARVSFQRFFRLYRNLSGMTGTAFEARHELWRIYRLPIVQIPTHRPCRRVRTPDRLFATMDEKWRAVISEVKAIHETGRPILIGTNSVEASEKLSALLKERGLTHEVLNAVRHAEEAQIISQAGQRGRITVATNMAGRGTDIKLGADVRELGGLAVIATQRDLSPRVDRQLFGRAGRQGDSGSAAVFACFEDELIQRYAPMIAKSLRTRFRLDDHGRIRSHLAHRCFASAQQRARRASSQQRQLVLRMDDWLEESLGFAGKDL